jgi:hypothetical protein
MTRKVDRFEGSGTLFTVNASLDYNSRCPFTLTQQHDYASDCPKTSSARFARDFNFFRDFNFRTKICVWMEESAVGAETA